MLYLRKHMWSVSRSVLGVISWVYDDVPTSYVGTYTYLPSSKYLVWAKARTG